jgi:hypothetical protein
MKSYSYKIPPPRKILLPPPLNTYYSKDNAPVDKYNKFIEKNPIISFKYLI